MLSVGAVQITYQQTWCTNIDYLQHNAKRQCPLHPKSLYNNVHKILSLFIPCQSLKVV